MKGCWQKLSESL
jgi:hypothetical protein